MIIAEVIVPIVGDMKDMIKVYAYDCRDSVAKENPKRFESCSRPDDLPYIWLLRPP